MNGIDPGDLIAGLGLILVGGGSYQLGGGAVCAVVMGGILLAACVIRLIKG